MKVYHCTLCEFANKNRTKVVYHLEGVHFKANLEAEPFVVKSIRLAFNRIQVPVLLKILFNIRNIVIMDLNEKRLEPDP